MMKKLVLLILAVFVTVFSFAQDAAEKINQANEALKAQEYAKAYKLYDEAMSNLGDDVQVPESINFNIGFAAYKSDNLEGALKYFNKSIELGINTSKAYEYIADLYSDHDSYEKAIENYNKAIETSEGEVTDLYYKAAVAAYKGEMYDKAVDFFTKSEAANFKPEISVYYKAKAYEKQNDNDKYLATLKEGIEKYPNDDRLQKELANVYFKEGYSLYKKGASIITDANSEVQKGSMTTADDKYKAEIEKAKGVFNDAIAVLEKAKELDPSDQNIAKVLDACKQSL